MAEKFPSWKQALITFFGGVLLAGTSCFGFLLTLEGRNDNISSFMAITFIASMVVILVGFVFVIMRVVQAMSEKGTYRNPSDPPPPPPPPGVGGLA
jgi:hypothetical protein